MTLLMPCFLCPYTPLEIHVLSVTLKTHKYLFLENSFRGFVDYTATSKIRFFFVFNICDEIYLFIQ